MKLKFYPVLFLLIVLPGLAQELDTGWLSYMNTSAELSSIQSQRQELYNEQLDLKTEMDQLQSNSSWYNGWLNKLLLSSNTRRQLEIIEALDQIDSRVEQLRLIQSQELTYLKAQYTAIVKNYEATGVIQDEQRTTAQRMGKLIMSESPKALSFPEYASLIHDNYSNPTMRKLVLKDVSVLLEIKILQLDSVLAQVEAEAELAQRLYSFHADLGLQIEADRDDQERDQTGEPAKNFSWSNVYDEALAGADGSYNLSPQEQSAQERQISGTEAFAAPVGREALEPGAEAPNQLSNTDYLKAKKLEYEVLLGQIDEELRSSQ